MSHRNHAKIGRAIGMGVSLILSGLTIAPSVLAHSPLMDTVLTDWCFGAPSNTFVGGGRVEDSYVELTCGNCSIATNRTCRVNSDCAPTGGTCINLTSKTERAWWDNRQDGAVNDLATVATTQDATNLFWGAQLWVDPDPVSFPFGQIAIDFTPGGRNEWYDPTSVLTTPGHCSGFTDRACTVNLPPYNPNADCHFCTMELEPPPSNRPRTCGSGCNPQISGNVCNTTQTCLNQGAGGLTHGMGAFSSPSSAADFLIVFDFSRWFVGLTDATHVFFNNGTSWEPAYNTQTNVRLTVDPAVDPGASGGSGGPPGSVEVAIPWSFFGPNCGSLGGGTQCPQGFGPGVDFQYTMIIARGNATGDWVPDGPIEDLMSEKVAGTTTTSPNSCNNPDPIVPAAGTFQNTICELSDSSTDAFVPPVAAVPGGAASQLLMSKGAGSQVTIVWTPSCSTADTDYEVYEGTVGNFYDHTQVAGLCSTGGMTTATFNASPGDRYYLVVPTDGSTEGSYGDDSTPAERPASTTPCRAQSLGTCP